MSTLKSLLFTFALLLAWMSTTHAAENAQRLIVGSAEALPPYTTGSAAQHTDGFMSASWKLVADQLQLDYELRVLPLHQLVDAFKAGEIDVLLNLPNNQSTKTFASFSSPIGYTPGAVFKLGDEEPNSTSDFSAFNAVVIHADQAQFFLEQFQSKGEIYLVDNLLDGLNALTSKRSDVLIASEASGLYAINQLGFSQIQPLEVPAPYIAELVFSVQPDNGPLLNEINAVIPAIINTPQFIAIYNTWLNQPRPSPQQASDYLNSSTPLLSILVLVFAYLLHLHRKQLKTITDEVKLTASVFNHAKESITITDAQGIIVNVNDTFTKTTGYSHEEVIGKNPNILKSGRQSKEFYQEMWRSLRENGHWYGEVWNRRKDGQVYAEMKTISAIYDKRGKPTHFLALCSDITSLKEKQHHLEHIAYHDALTGLPNRTLLTDRINQAIIHSKRGNSVFAVVFIDLDGFKAINDTHGHDVGDELLITLSRRMQAALREGDTLARIGGDEFIAVLTNLGHAKDTEVVLSRLLDVACSDVTVEGLTVSVSASMGVTLYPEDEVDPEKLVLHADQAMYIAKRSGKNRCHFFDINKDVDVTSRQQIINSVRDALATDNLVLHYQPKINLNTGDVIGVEGLLRMQQQDALVMAGEFMPAILNSDLDIQVGKWVIEHAIKQSIDWQKQGLDLTLSINISTHHLQQVDFVAHLNELLHAYPDFDTQRLKFEILESSTMKDTTHIYNVICSCQALGIHFILDNFGTGYSSITHLQQLPGCSITLDHSLIKAMHDDPYQTSLVKGVIELAKSFKREVIAKGIENEASKRALQELGCELAQGFDIAPPMSAQDLTVWINA